MPKYECQIENQDQLDVHGTPLNRKTIPHGVESESKEDDEIDEEDESNLKYAGDSRVFQCQNSLCHKRFKTKGGLERHQNGWSKCIENLRLESIENYMKRRFQGMYGITSNPQSARISRKLVTHFENLKPAILFDGNLLDKLDQGESLHKPAEIVRLKPHQITYLERRFNDGLEGKKKARADLVSQQMRSAKDDFGELIFSYEDWLAEARIKRFFSAMAAKNKKAKKLTNIVSESTSSTQSPTTIKSRLHATATFFSPGGKSKRKANQDMTTPSKVAKAENDPEAGLTEEILEDAAADLDALQDSIDKRDLHDVVNDERFENMHPIKVIIVKFI